MWSSPNWGFEKERLWRSRIEKSEPGNSKRITIKVQSLITSFVISNETDVNMANKSRLSCGNTNIPRATSANRAANHTNCNLVDISYLPIYYNNVRGVTSKNNICTKIELSIYKILVLIETWLSKRESSSVYFPRTFKVYRQDRIVPNSLRRYGGVAIIVHQELCHQRLKLKECNEAVECVAVEIKLKPISLILYAAYIRVFDAEVAMKHIEHVKDLCNRFGTHRIMVLGDFNMRSVR